MELRYRWSEDTPTYGVDFGAAGRARVVIEGSAGRSVYLLKSNVSGHPVPAPAAGRARSSIPGPGVDSPSPGSIDDGERRILPVDVRRIHGASRAFDAAAIPPREGMRNASRSPRTVVEYGAPAPGLVAGTSRRAFWVQDAAGGWMQLEATLRAVGDHCYIWVPDRSYSGGTSSRRDGKLSLVQIERFRDSLERYRFDPFLPGAYVAMTNLFGFEYGGGPGGDGGRDGDKHLSLLLYDIGVDHVPGADPSGVYGFFWGKDHYDQSSLDGIAQAQTPPAVPLKTNSMEILYIDAPALDDYPDASAYTLVHEFQHMIQFAVKNVGRGLAPPRWYNEMCSLVAECLCAGFAGVEDTGYGPDSWLHEFCRHYAETGVAEWQDGIPSVFRSHASAYAFGLYLAGNCGGARLFSRMLASDSVGIQSIEDAFASLGRNETFGEASRRFGEILVFRWVPGGRDVRSVWGADFESLEAGGLRYQYGSRDLDQFRQYDVMAGSWVQGTESSGPRRYAPEEELPLRPWGLSLHAKPEWMYAARDITIEIEAPADPSVAVSILVR